MDPITAATIGRPFAEILLQPDREERVDGAGSQAAIGIASGEVQKRIERDLRPPVFLVSGKEAVLGKWTARAKVLAKPTTLGSRLSARASPSHPGTNLRAGGRRKPVGAIFGPLEKLH